MLSTSAQELRSGLDVLGTPLKCSFRKSAGKDKEHEVKVLRTNCRWPGQQVHKALASNLGYPVIF